MIRLVSVLLAVVATGYLALMAFVWSQERRMLFPASPVRTMAASAGLAGVQDVLIRTEDGETLVAWWRPPEPGRAIVLYFHGNSGALVNRRERVKLLVQDGRGVLMLSYRGYGGSTGSPSEAGLRQDAEAAYAWLGSYDPARIVLYGESLGTGVAVTLAAERRVGGVVLDAPYASIVSIAAELFWYLPVSLLMRDPFRSIDRIGRIGAPLLILHGEQDGLIPPAQSERLYAAAAAPKRRIVLPGVGHSSVLEGGGLPALRAFLDAVEAKRPSEDAAPPRP